MPGLACQTLFNPFYGSSDNLVTCWLARGVMSDDFLLLNGDTIFEGAVLERVLDAPPAARDGHDRRKHPTTKTT